MAPHRTRLVLRQVADVAFASRNATVDVRHNSIESGTWEAAVDGPMLLLSHNPLRCDCRLAALAALTTTVGGRCASPESLVGRALRSLRPEELVCTLRSRCPHACRCLERPHDARLLLACPAAAVADALIPAPDLSVLGLVALELRVEGPAPRELALPPLPPELVALRLAGLGIATVRFGELPQRLEVSYRVSLFSAFSRRTITESIENERRSQEVDLNDNAISRMEAETARRLLSGVRRVRLARNPIDCDCDNLPFLETLVRHRTRIVDLESLACAAGARLETRALCDGGAATSWTHAAYSALGVMLLAACCAGAMLEALRRRRRRRRRAMSPGALCVVCAREDTEFAARELVPELERAGWRARLAGDSGEEVEGEAARTADALVAVVSASFVRRVWSEVVRREVLSKRGRLTVAVAMAVAASEEEASDLELRTLLSSTTLVQWKEPWCRERLRTALRAPARRPCPVTVVGRKRPRDDETGLIRAAGDRSSRVDVYCNELKINPASKHSEV